MNKVVSKKKSRTSCEKVVRSVVMTPKQVKNKVFKNCHKVANKFRTSNEQNLKKL